MPNKNSIDVRCFGVRSARSPVICAELFTCLRCLRLLPACRLLHARPQKCQDDGDDGQVSEYDARAQHAQRRENKEKGKNDDWTEIPENLGDTAVFSPAARRRHFRYKRPRCRNVCPDGKANQHKAHNDHPGLKCEDQPEHAKGVEQHVILIDFLAPEDVAKASAHQSSNACRNCVGTEGAQQSQKVGTEMVLRGPKGQGRRPRYDRSRIYIVGQSCQYRIFPIIGGARCCAVQLQGHHGIPLCCCGPLETPHGGADQGWRRE